VVDPLVVALDVFTTPRLHVADVEVLVQLPELALAEFTAEVVPWTLEVNTAPLTGSPMLYTG
jgi:hypothetical protein